jgi:hypothetical protein
MLSLTILAAAATAATQTVPSTTSADLAAIDATCHDYLDGQLQGDAARVARSLHPDLAKRKAVGETADEKFGLRRMTKEELVAFTKQGLLKTPEAQWDRSCKILDVTDSAASVRAETPWFVDYFHMGRFGDRWLIVNALWYGKPKNR